MTVIDKILDKTVRRHSRQEHENTEATPADTTTHTTEGGLDALPPPSAAQGTRDNALGDPAPVPAGAAVHHHQHHNAREEEGKGKGKAVEHGAHAATRHGGEIDALPPPTMSQGPAANPLHDPAPVPAQAAVWSHRQEDHRAPINELVGGQTAAI